MLDLLSAQKRQEEAAQSIESTLKSLSPGTLRTALAAAETGGDAVEIRFRQQAVETYEDLVERRERMGQGIARTEAALDALMLALAQATAPDPQAADSVEADSLRLAGQVEALRHATAELDALETEPSPPGRGRERA
jgi:multidrug resistance efflux pump